MNPLKKMGKEVSLGFAEYVKAVNDEQIKQTKLLEAILEELRSDDDD